MRTRLVKPGFFKDADLASCCPLSRILFLGLACLADRDGRLRDKPAEIKVEILPHDAVEIEPLLDELHRMRLIQRYVVSGLRLIQVSKDARSFQKHARPHRDEICENYPPPPGAETGNPAKFPDELSSSLLPSSPLPSTVEGGVVEPFAFAEFMRRYPKKSNRQQALAEWEALQPSAELIARLSDAITTHQKHNPQWLREKGRYIPAAAKWLRDREWEWAPSAATTDGPSTEDIERDMQRRRQSK